MMMMPFLLSLRRERDTHTIKIFHQYSTMLKDFFLFFFSLIFKFSIVPVLNKREKRREITQQGRRDSVALTFRLQKALTIDYFFSDYILPPPSICSDINARQMVIFRRRWSTNSEWSSTVHSHCTTRVDVTGPNAEGFTSVTIINRLYTCKEPNYSLIHQQ